MPYLIKQGFAVIATTFVLAGCVTDANYGQIERKGAGMFLDKLTVTREGAYQTDNFARCVTLHAKSRKILLSDSRYNFRGAYTGRYYTFDKQYRTTDGKSYQRVSDDGKFISTYGNARWRFALYDRFMEYHLAAENTGDKRYYVFDSVTAGGIDTGDTKNKGAFWPLAARGAEGKAGLKTLVDIVDTIEQCQRDLEAK